MITGVSRKVGLGWGVIFGLDSSYIEEDFFESYTYRGGYLKAGKSWQLKRAPENFEKNFFNPKAYPVQTSWNNFDIWDKGVFRCFFRLFQTNLYLHQIT